MRYHDWIEHEAEQANKAAWHERLARHAPPTLTPADLEAVRELQETLSKTESQPTCREPVVRTSDTRSAGAD